MDDFTINFLQPVNEEKIYHYTTIGALKKILETRSLHLSQILFSNDYTEFTDGNIFFWEKWLPVATSRGIDGNLINRIKNHYRYKEFVQTVGRKQDLCFISFCSGAKSGDLLSQWRAYAQNGYGIAIAFDAKVIESICKDKGFTFGKCFYNEEEKMEACYKLCMHLLEPGLETEEEFKKVLFALTAIFGLFSKNVNFSEEKEVRIATHPSIELGVKERARGLVAYYHLDISNTITNLIKEVIIGPCQVNRYDEMKKVVEILLKKAKLHKCDITKSTIPYQT